MLIYFGISIIPIGLYLVVKNYCVFEQIPNDWITKPLVGFVDRKYDDNTSAAILLICFGMKNNSESWIIYNQTKHLSIVYLLSVGGFQVSFLKLLINKIVRHKLTSKIISLIIISFYCYVLSFRSGILRVLLCLIFSMSLSKVVRNKYDILALSGMFTIFIEPSAVFNFGFCLSYLCTYFVMWVFDQEFSNVVLEMLLVNVGCLLISIPFLAKMEGVVSITNIFFGVGFSIIFGLLYIWYFFTWFLVFLKPIHTFLANGLFFIINEIYSINVEVKVGKLCPYIDSVFYCGCLVPILFIDKYKKNHELRLQEVRKS
ncbi:MAG: ComEC/Rec2 family competence protein [Mycoplasmataceae bacterium]|nr:ComEC/Rec2 family competence protein [Mycoplasmataceae bacterium]